MRAADPNGVFVSQHCVGSVRQRIATARSVLRLASCCKISRVFSNEKDASSLELASTVLDAPSTESMLAVNPPVTVVGPTLHFSEVSERSSFEEKAFVDRYEGSSLLGEGGVGEVRLTHDARIGREVAMKVIRLAQGSRPKDFT